MAFKSSYHLQLDQLPKMDAEVVLVGGHDSKMAFESSYQLWAFRLPKPDAKRPSTRGHDSKLHAEGASFRAHKSKVAFKSCNHLRPCRLTKLDDEGALAGQATQMWPSSLRTIRSYAGYPSWTLKGLKLGVTTPRWPSNNRSTICSRAGYPSWTTKGRQVGLTTLSWTLSLLTICNRTGCLS